MNRLFFRPHLVRHLVRHVGINTRLDGQLTKIRAMREKYVTKLNLKRNGETEILLGLASLEDLDAFSEKKKSEVTYNELVDLLRIGSITLVDVRDPKELMATGTMPQSVNIPLNQLKNTLCCEEEGIANDVDGNAIVFCGLGNVKSVTALEIAHKLGLKNARHYPGGYNEWVQEAAKLLTKENSTDVLE